MAKNETNLEGKQVTKKYYNQLVYNQTHSKDFVVNVTDIYFAQPSLSPEREQPFKKIQQAALGAELYIVANCTGQQGTLKIKLKETKPAIFDQPVKFLVDGIEKEEIEFKITQGVFTYYQKIKLRPQDNNRFQQIGKKLGEHKDKKTALYLQVKVTNTRDKVIYSAFTIPHYDALEGCNVVDFQKGSFAKNKFEVLPPKTWHDPVDNPMLCLYTQNGNYRPRYNVFGKVRKERTSINHQGIDLLALPDSNVYACVDAFIEFIEVQGGYGNVICLKVKNPKEFLERKRDFNLVYKNEGEMLEGSGFNYGGDFYLFYAHLKKINISIKNKEVKCGELIGINGTSGYGTTKDPHLHFEVRNKSRSAGLNNRCHPGLFINYKGESEMTESEKKYHKEIAQKYWD